MIIIRDISEMIENKIEDAEYYIKSAIEYKDENPELAKALFSISESDISNINTLHGVVVKIIQEYRRENGEPPAPMLAVYDYLHKKHIDKITKVKAMHALYKDSSR